MANSFSSAVLSIFASKAYVLVLGVVFTPVLVRLLGPVEYGRYALVLSVYSSPVSSWCRERETRFESTSPNGRIPSGRRPSSGTSSGRRSFSVQPLPPRRHSRRPRGSSRPFSARRLRRCSTSSGRSSSPTNSPRTSCGRSWDSSSSPGRTLKIVDETVFIAAALAFVYAGYGVEGVLLGSIVGSTVTIVIGLVVVVRRIPVRRIVFPAASNSRDGGSSSTRSVRSVSSSF